MLIDPLAEQVGIGGAVAILMTATVLRFLPAFAAALKAQKNGITAKLSDLEKFEIEEIVRHGNEQHIVDIRNLLDARNEKVRQIIREELRDRRVYMRQEDPRPYIGEERRK